MAKEEKLIKNPVLNLSPFPERSVRNTYTQKGIYTPKAMAIKYILYCSKSMVLHSKAWQITWRFLMLR